MCVYLLFRESLEALDKLRGDVSTELALVEKALAARMRMIVASGSSSLQHLPPLDLAGLHVLSQVNVATVRLCLVMRATRGNTAYDRRVRRA